MGSASSALGLGGLAVVLVTGDPVPSGLVIPPGVPNAGTAIPSGNPPVIHPSVQIAPGSLVSGHLDAAKKILLDGPNSRIIIRD
jgi:hypothetical protein